MNEAPDMLAPAAALPISTTLVDFPNAALSRRSVWNNVVARSDTNTIFQTWEWHMSWWQAFGDGARPLVLWVEQGDELLGIAPLMISQRRPCGARRRIVEFIGTGSSDYSDFIVDKTQPHVLTVMLRWLADHRHEWDVLRLTNIPSSSTSLQWLSEVFTGLGYWHDARVVREAPTYIFGQSDDDRKLTRKKSLKRHYNYLKKQGDLTFATYVSEHEIAQMLDAFFQQHTQRWQSDPPGGIIQFSDDRQRRFYRELVRNLSLTGWLHFSVVMLDDVAIAFHFGFEYAGRFIWYKPTFDISYARYSPGEVLIKFLLEHAIERGVREFDFTIGEEAFKYRFANLVRKTCDAYTLRRWGDYRALRFWLNTRSFVSDNPALARLARPLYRRWQRRRHRR